MISSTNKTISFFLGAGLTILSWALFFLNVILKITNLSQFGLYNIDTIGFLSTTIITTIYTVYILFKFSSIAYLPGVLILMHLATLSGSVVILFVVIDLLLLIILNAGAFQSNEKKEKQTTYYESNASKNRISDNDIFDAEFYTKDE